MQSFMPKPKHHIIVCPKCGEMIVYRTHKPDVCTKCGVSFEKTMIDSVLEIVEEMKKY